MPPMTIADVNAPTRIASCCAFGVPPTRWPVFRSCEVVPPFEAAMQTTAAIERAANWYSGPTQPRRTNTRQVNSNVATVIPEIGFDDEPISPVSRDETVTNRKPKSTTRIAPTIRPTWSVGISVDEAIAATRPTEPSTTNQPGRSRSVRRTWPVAFAFEPPRVRSRNAPAAEPRIIGRTWKTLMMPPVATAPAPM